jgi:hypothetical protein
VTGPRRLVRGARAAALLARGAVPALRAMRGLGPRDRAAVLRALCRLALVEVYLADAGDGGIRELVGRCRAGTGWARRPAGHPARAAHPRVTADQAAWSVEVAAGCLPRSRCLAEAFTLYRLLSADGLDPALVIGVSRGERSWLAAHAWVELDAEPVCQPAQVRRVYVPIMRVSRREPA